MNGGPQGFSRSGSMWYLLVPMLLFTAVSCSLAGTSDDALVLWPPGGLPVLGGADVATWDLTWIAEKGGLRHRRVSSGGKIVLNMVRERPVILRAVPYTGIRELTGIRPAGCILPSHRTGLEVLPLSWEDGFAADFLINLASAGLDPRWINIPRFRDAVLSRSAGAPWTLDRERLGADVVSGDLWIYSFRLLPEVSAVLPLPTGSWYSAYPPDPVFTADRNGWSGTLTVGVHRFMLWGGGDSRIVAIDERGTVLMHSGN